MDSAANVAEQIVKARTDKNPRNSITVSTILPRKLELPVEVRGQLIGADIETMFRSKERSKDPAQPFDFWRFNLHERFQPCSTRPAQISRTRGRREQFLLNSGRLQRPGE